MAGAQRRCSFDLQWGKNVDSFHLLLKAGGGLIICRRDQDCEGQLGTAVSVFQLCKEKNFSLFKFHVLLERDNVQISQTEMTVGGDSERL